MPRARTNKAAEPKKVLMIAYAFPPTGGPGVQRPAKFAKYLPQFGWQPIVWSADRVDGLPRDESLAQEIPAAVPVYACSTGGLQAARRTVRGLAGPANGNGPARGLSTFAAAIDWRLTAWCAAHCVPDDGASWARRSVRPVLDLIRSERIDVIYSTFSPASNHLLALELKRRTKLPWVAEFRDLWLDDGRYRESSPRNRAAHQRLQQETLEQADAVIAVTPRQTEILAGHVPGTRRKFHTITNGFDPDDFRDVPRRAGRSTCFVMAHVGRLDVARTTDEVCSAMRTFANQLGSSRSRFVLRIIGHSNPVSRERLAATGLPCEFVGYVPHAEAVRAMCSADALLLTVPDGRNADTILCGKLFEYLASARPIIAIGPLDGECERLVRACRAGLTAPFAADPILGALEEVYDAWRAGRPLQGCSADRLEPFSRVELTRQLAGLLEGVVRPPAAARATTRPSIPAQRRVAVGVP
jgi:glycosyltransferase involved in cell wall biosynthesis